MKQVWHTLKTKFEANEPRERLLIFGAVVAAVYLIWDTFFILPAQKEMDKLRSQLEKNQHAVTKAEAEVQVLSRLSGKGPSAQINGEMNSLQQSLNKLDEDIAELSTALMPAKQLPIMIHDVLKTNPRLALVNLETRPVEPILLASDQDTGNADEQDEVPMDTDTIVLYRHGVDLTFKAKYSEAVDYLQALENIQWQFYWDDLSYHVTNHPFAEVTLSVFTLSSGKGVFEGE